MHVYFLGTVDLILNIKQTAYSVYPNEKDKQRKSSIQSTGFIVENIIYLVKRRTNGTGSI